MSYVRINPAAMAVLLLAVVIALGACAPAAVAPTAVPTVAPTSAPTSAPTTAPPQPKAVTLQVTQNDKLGKFLADGDGRTLYLLTKDTKNTSNCYDKCAASWPAVLPDGKPTLKDGVADALIGTTQRKDGSTQLTYNGWPVYYYAPDKNPGDTNGQGVGKVWWVVSGEGNPVKPAGLQVTNNAKLGNIINDDTGRTLYVFLKDTKDTSVCYDKCEQTWPPLLSLGAPTTAAGVDASLLGSTQRKDGTTQVTYKGMPLYYYAPDKAPGDTNGQGIGNVWYVTGPDGNPIKQ